MAIINRYSEENDLESMMHELPSKAIRKEKRGSSPKKGNTFSETLRLYKEGKTINDIAAIRNLATGTIESHLTQFLRSGEIDINQLIDEEKLVLIKSVVQDFDGGSITPLKQKAGNAVSFNEIRWVIAAMGIDTEKST